MAIIFENWSVIFLKIENKPKNDQIFLGKKAII